MARLLEREDDLQGLGGPCRLGLENHEMGRHTVVMMMLLLGVCAAIDMLLEGSQNKGRVEVVEVIYNG